MGDNYLATMESVGVYMAFIIGFPSGLLYVYQIVTIILTPTMRTTFYALFIVRSVPDLILMSVVIYAYELPNLGFLLDFLAHAPHWVLIQSWFWTRYSQHSNNLATTMMLINRWTAISMPVAYSKIWRTFLPIAVFIVYCLPLPFTLQFFNIPVMPYLSNGSFAILEDPSIPINQSQTPYYNLQGILSALLFCLTTAFLNIGILYSYRKAKRSTAVAANNFNSFNSRNNVERKLLIYTIVTFFGHLLSVILTLTIYIFTLLENNEMLLIFYAQFNWIFNFGCIALPSWFLFWASSDIRERSKGDLRKIVPKRIYKLFCNSTSTTPVQPMDSTNVLSAIAVSNNNNNVVAICRK